MSHTPPSGRRRPARAADQAPAQALHRPTRAKTGPAEGAGRGEVLSAQCPSREVLQHVTSRWGVLVLVVLLRGGSHRFSELRRRIEGVSEKMLAQTLQTLEADGFVRRTAHAVVPPHVDYALSPLGREMGLQVAEMVDWIEGNLPRILAGRGPCASGDAAGEEAA